MHSEIPAFIGQLHRPGPGDYVVCLQQWLSEPEARHRVCSAGPGRTLTCASSKVSSSNSAYRSLADERVDAARDLSSVTWEASSMGLTSSCIIGNRFIFFSVRADGQRSGGLAGGALRAELAFTKRYEV